MLAAIGGAPRTRMRSGRWLAMSPFRFDIPLVEIATHELEDANYLANPTNRCFYCKTGVMAAARAARARARTRGRVRWHETPTICENTGREKRRGSRRAYDRHSRRSDSPRLDIRAASRELGLPTWDAPAAPCLSSRLQYGLSITPSRLKQVEEGEAYLRALGVTGDLRVRHLGGWPASKSRRRGFRGSKRGARPSRLSSRHWDSRRSRSIRAATDGEPVRAFVALNFPDRLRHELWGALAPLRERREKLPVKWVRPENIHLSLKFLGDVGDAREPELREALQRAAGARREPRPPGR